MCISLSLSIYIYIYIYIQMYKYASDPICIDILCLRAYSHIACMVVLRCACRNCACHSKQRVSAMSWDGAVVVAV